MKLLAISGSLRKSSYNSAAIEALKLLAPDPIHIHIEDIGALPLFNPDNEDKTIPALRALKASLNESAGIIIASPEYAHGISGALKNALDWLVSGAEFPNKPIMLINTSPRASHAQAALVEVLTTMSGIIIEPACLSVPLLGSNLDTKGIVATAEIAEALGSALNRFTDEIETTIAKKYMFIQ